MTKKGQLGKHAKSIFYPKDEESKKWGSVCGRVECSCYSRKRRKDSGTQTQRAGGRIENTSAVIGDLGRA